MRREREREKAISKRETRIEKERNPLDAKQELAHEGIFDAGTLRRDDERHSKPQARERNPSELMQALL